MEGGGILEYWDSHEAICYSFKNDYSNLDDISIQIQNH